jgi:hypothetical protein
MLLACETAHQNVVGMTSLSDAGCFFLWFSPANENQPDELFRASHAEVRGSYRLFGLVQPVNLTMLRQLSQNGLI